MKKFFEEPVINISCFETENVVTVASSGGTDGVSQGEAYLNSKGYEKVDKIDVSYLFTF